MGGLGVGGGEMGIGWSCLVNVGGRISRLGRYERMRRIEVVLGVRLRMHLFGRVLGYPETQVENAVTPSWSLGLLVAPTTTMIDLEPFC